jgi:hypothetical protein
MRYLSLPLFFFAYISFECSAFHTTVVPSRHYPFPGFLRPSRNTFVCNAVATSSSSSSDISNILDQGNQMFQSLKLKLGYTSKRTARLRPPIGTETGFCGTVEEIGTVSEISAELLIPGVTLTVDCCAILSHAYEGCSLAINGVAVPVIKCGRKFLKVNLLFMIFASFHG